MGSKKLWKWGGQGFGQAPSLQLLNAWEGKKAPPRVEAVTEGQVGHVHGPRGSCG